MAASISDGPDGLRQVRSSLDEVDSSREAADLSLSASATNRPYLDPKPCRVSSPTYSQSSGHSRRTLSATMAVRLGSVYRPNSPRATVSARSPGSSSKKLAVAATCLVHGVGLDVREQPPGVRGNPIRRQGDDLADAGLQPARQLQPAQLDLIGMRGAGVVAHEADEVDLLVAHVR